MIWQQHKQTIQAIFMLKYSITLSTHQFQYKKGNTGSIDNAYMTFNVKFCISIAFSIKMEYKQKLRQIQ